MKLVRFLSDSQVFSGRVEENAILPVPGESFPREFS